MIDVDPDESRTGSSSPRSAIPYGPNAERGIFRSTDGGQTFEKVLYKDEYTSGNDVRIDPSDPNIVYAALWQQQQSFIEGGGFGGAGGRHLQVDRRRHDLEAARPTGCPTCIQANLAIAPSNPKVLYAMVAARRAGGAAAARRRRRDDAASSASTSRPTAASTGTSRCTTRRAGGARARPDSRPLARIGGGDLPTIAVDPKNENVVYSSSTVFWRTEDGGVTWSAVRGAPGGDDYQKTWINPNNPNIILAVVRPGRASSRRNRGAVVEQLVHAAHGGDVSRVDRQRVPLSRVRRPAGLGLGVRRQPLDGRRDHVPRLASGEHPGVRHRGARPEGSRPGLRQRAHQRLALQPQDRADDARRSRRADAARHATSTATCARCRSTGRRSIHDVLFYASNAVWKTIDRGAQLDAHQPRPHAADVGGAGERRASTRAASRRRRWARSPRSRRRRATSTCSGRAPTTATSR